MFPTYIPLEDCFVGGSAVDLQEGTPTVKVAEHHFRNVVHTSARLENKQAKL